MSENQQAPEPTEHHDHLDIAAEKARLEALGQRIKATAKHAEDDLEMGHKGRTFVDSGVRTQVERSGDTHHPPADR
ncbi:hypothetical protein [Aquihabitans sp. McL0605]|uniref:hypothetical protein n=1 Tax=Aquihabitans sp. McL0605 TaxID=3415671 RepID=UPI003CEC6CC1